MGKTKRAANKPHEVFFFVNMEKLATVMKAH